MSASAVKVIRHLLVNSNPLTTVVSTEKIMAGKLPQGVELPAISIMHVSTIRRHPVASTITEFCTSRVQVTVAAPNYPDKAQILGLIHAALPQMRGAIAGVNVDSILSDVDGPDFSDDEIGVCQGSKDYIVKLNE